MPAIWAAIFWDRATSLELQLHISAGRYMCGEETGQRHALEGKRATLSPGQRPVGQTLHRQEPRDAVQRAAHRGARGVAWYKGLSRSDDGGTKIYGVSGKVKRPGAWELTMGTTIREILEGHAGGMRDGVAFRGVLPGGGSTDFLVA
jgi:NADH-quinone oxidoreductase subunit F